MAKVGLFYGSTTGNTAEGAEEIDLYASGVKWEAIWAKPRQTNSLPVVAVDK